MQVIGICRFSYPAIGGFQVEHGTPEERAAFLYAPDRMEERFRYFQAFTLPSIRAQTDPDFTFLIVVGTDLPDIWGNRLWNLTQDIPQVRIQEHPPGPHRKVMKRAIQSMRTPGQTTLEFRLDDDDAVGRDFVARLRAEARDRETALTGNRHIALDFRSGYIAVPGPNGIAARPTNAPFMTAGLAVAFEPDSPVTVMNFSHVKLARFMQCFSIDSSAMYVRGYSRWNDSRQTDPDQTGDLLPLAPKDEDLFRARFGIDATQVRQIFNA
jgi:hypothetical protein